MKAVFIALAAMFLGTTSYAHPGHGGHLVFAGGKIHAHLSWEKAPDGKGGESKMRLEWHDGATHELMEPGLPFGVALWMPSMGHGSAPTQIQRVLNDRGEVIPGTYMVTNMYFMMPGDWDIRVALKYADGREERKAWSIVVEGDDHGGHHH
jgi:hypothetical protein